MTKLMTGSVTLAASQHKLCCRRKGLLHELQLQKAALSRNV